MDFFDAIDYHFSWRFGVICRKIILISGLIWVANRKTQILWDKLMKFYSTTSILALAMTAGLSVPTIAQDAGDEVQSVYEKYRPDFSAPGARTGSFLFYPTIEGSVKYDSNIYKARAGVTQSNAGEIDDFIFQIKPGFNLTSDWNQNAFSFYADADIAKYGDNSGEDYEDFNVGANGRIDVSRGTFINYGASYSDKHEDRGSPDTTTNAAEQTVYESFKANVGFVRDLSLVSLAVDGNYEKLDFDDVALNSGGTLNNDDRDRERWAGSVRLGYEVDQYYETFVKFSANRVEYDDSQEDGGPQRNSDGWEVVAGAAFDITGTSQGEIFGGYVKQNYDSDSLEGVDDFTFGASLLWSPTGLTSVRTSVSRSVTETTLTEVINTVNTPAAGILGTLFNLQLEHELQRNVLLKGTATYTRQDFKNINRADDLFNASLGARYLLNRNFAVDATYTFDARDTTVALQDYKSHIFMVSLRSQW